MRKRLPADFAVLDQRGRTQSQLPCHCLRGGVSGMDIGDHQTNSVRLQPVEHRAGRFSCQPMPLKIRCDHPRDAGFQGRTAVLDGRLHVTDRADTGSRHDDPVQPPLRLVLRMPNSLRCVSPHQLPQRRRVAADEPVERRIGEHLDHLCCVIDRERFQSNADGLQRLDRGPCHGLNADSGGRTRATGLPSGGGSSMTQDHEIGRAASLASGGRSPAGTPRAVVSRALGARRVATTAGCAHSVTTMLSG